MEIQKLYDLDDIEFEDIAIGLVRLAKDIPAHEFFSKSIKSTTSVSQERKTLSSMGIIMIIFFQDLRPTTSFQRPVSLLFQTNLLKVSKKKFRPSSLQEKKTLNFY